MAKKILLADDSITIQKVIELTFSDEDFDVITVGNGRLALERLPEVRPDIVLCDIIMPEKDGYEVCEQVKSSPAWSHVPVLLLTGAFEPFDQERAARAGYDGSLAKPFEPETLIAKVKDLLSRAPARPPAPAPPVSAPAPAPPVSAPAPAPAAAAPPPLAPPPTVIPFVRPAAPPAASPLDAGFIPDEPFPDVPARAPASPPVAPPLASLSAEESETLMARPVPAAEDAASTVMFRPSELQWSAPAPPAAPAAPSAPPSAPPVAPPPIPRLILSEPPAGSEPTFVPEGREPLPPAGVAEEPPVFEPVMDEDLDFGPGGFEPEPPMDETTGGETLFAPEPTATAEPEPLPEPLRGPVPEPAPEPLAEVVPEVEFEPELERAPSPVAGSSVEDLLGAAAGDLGVSTLPPAPPPSFVEESPLEPASYAAAEDFATPAGEPVLEPPPEPPAVVADALPDLPVPGPAGSLESPPRWEPEPAVEERVAEPVAPPPPGQPTVLAPPPSPAAPEPASSLADLAPPEEPVAVPVSQAGAVSVPVDMVERIAQRVVAQVSEKVVREIAWEVIPDLAEVLIKQEIERLKADLAKT